MIVTNWKCEKRKYDLVSKIKPIPEGTCGLQNAFDTTGIDMENDAWVTKKGPELVLMSNFQRQVQERDSRSQRCI